MKFLQIFVSGRVQGVGYRYFVLRKAQELDLKGYVRNLYDGRVEVVIEKTAEKEILDDFLSGLKAGPYHADVKNISIDEIERKKTYSGFQIKY